MFNIKIDKTLALYLSTKKIRLEELFVIACFNFGQQDLLKEYLTGKTGDQMSAYFQTMERKMLVRRITPGLEDFDWDNYELTDASDQIFDECSTALLEQEATIIGHQEVPDEMQESDFDAFIGDFIDLFPEGVRNRGGDYLRTNKKDLTNKMQTFMRKYKGYTPEVIKAATKQYLSKQARDNYAWCNAAHFFISKNGVSKLATECESYLKGEESGNDSTWTNNLM